MTLAFNEDRVVQREVKRIVEWTGVRYAVETGACGGATTEYLATLMPHVAGIEVNHEFIQRYLWKLNDPPRVLITEGDSAAMLPVVIGLIPRNESVLFYLDAHTDVSSPLRTELEIIGQLCYDRAVVIIDDFEVPGRSLGFDTFYGMPNGLDFIGHLLPELGTGVRWYFSDAADVTNPIRNTAGKIYIFPERLWPEEFVVREGAYCYSDLR